MNRLEKLTQKPKTVTDLKSETDPTLDHAVTSPVQASQHDDGRVQIPNGCNCTK